MRILILIFLFFCIFGLNTKAMRKLTEILALIYFFFQAFMPLLGAFVYAFLVDSYNWIAAIIGFLGSIIYGAYFINHFTLSKNIIFAILTIVSPLAIVLYECSVSGTPLSSFFLKTAFVNLCALTLATSLPLLAMSIRSIAILPGAMVLAGISAGILWLLYFTAAYLEPNDINQSFQLLLIAVATETLTTVFGLFEISDAIEVKSNNLLSKFFTSTNSKFFKAERPQILTQYHDQIMTAIGATSFVAFFVLIVI